jgi:hypothetical protein
VIIFAPPCGCTVPLPAGLRLSFRRERYGIQKCQIGTVDCKFSISLLTLKTTGANVLQRLSFIDASLDVFRS